MVDTTREKQTGAENIFWDLSEYYASPDDPQIDEDLSQIETMVDEFVSDYRGNVAELVAEEISEAYERIEAFYEKMNRIGVYAHLNFSVHSVDPKWGAFVQKITERSSQLYQKIVFFDLEWNEIDDERAQSIMDELILRNYRHQLEAERRYKPYQLSEVEEKLLIEKSVTGSSAWSRFFDQVTSSLLLDWEGKKLPFEQVLSKLAGNPNREERKAAADSVTAGLKEKQMELAYIFNTLAADKASDDRLRGYPSWISSRNLGNKASDETVEALIQSVAGNYDLVARHYTIKKVLLGYDELFDYDRYAPLELKESDAFYPWEKARQIVLDCFASFYPRMAEIAQRFFDENWIHAPVMAGKQGGAFCMRGTKTSHPWVMLNYTATVSDVMTMAHELGHGIHSYLTIEKQTPLNMDFTITTAEIASIFGEMIVFKTLLEQEKDPALKLTMLTQKIDSTIATVFRQISLNRFEDAMHNARRSEGELSVDRLNELWMQSQNDMFQDSVNMRDDYGIWWSYIWHFVGAPGYVYAYAFGELLVFALYNLYEQQGVSFIPHYMELLEAGGSDYPEKMLAKVGVDLNDPNFWNGGIDLIRQMVDQEEALAKELYSERF
jgi:oligoendopeptidase F